MNSPISAVIAQRIEEFRLDFIRNYRKNDNIAFPLRKYYKKGIHTQLTKDTHVNEYFNKIGNAEIYTPICIQEDIRNVKQSKYDYQYHQETYIINNTHRFLCMLKPTGEMIKIRPMPGKTNTCAKQHIWVVTHNDYGYFQEGYGHAIQGEAYSTPTPPGCPLPLNADEPKTDTIGYAIDLMTLDTPDRTPIYVDHLNVTLSVTEPGVSITQKEIDAHTIIHPKFATPEIFLSKYKEELLKEVSRSDNYRIVVNDPTSTYDHYYVCINNSITKIAVTHDESKEYSLSIIYTYPGIEVDTHEEKILTSISDHDKVFQKSTTILIPSNKRGLDFNHRLICGTDFASVQKALEHHYYYNNSSGCVSQAERDDELREITEKIEEGWKTKNEILRAKISKAKADLDIMRVERDQYKELYENRLVAAADERKAAIEETKLQREQVATRGKEVSTTGDMAKIIIGACTTMGGALLYYFANREKKEKSVVKTVATVTTGGGILSGIVSLASKALSSITSVFTSPIGLFGLLF